LVYSALLKNKSHNEFKNWTGNIKSSGAKQTEFWKEFEKFRNGEITEAMLPEDVKEQLIDYLSDCLQNTIQKVSSDDNLTGQLTILRTQYQCVASANIIRRNEFVEKNAKKN